MVSFRALQIVDISAGRPNYTPVWFRLTEFRFSLYLLFSPKWETGKVLFYRQIKWTTKKWTWLCRRNLHLSTQHSTCWDPLRYREKFGFCSILCQRLLSYRHMVRQLDYRMWQHRVLSASTPPLGPTRPLTQPPGQRALTEGSPGQAGGGHLHPMGHTMQTWVSCLTSPLLIPSLPYKPTSHQQGGKASFVWWRYLPAWEALSAPAWTAWIKQPIHFSKQHLLQTGATFPSYCSWDSLLFPGCRAFTPSSIRHQVSPPGPQVLLSLSGGVPVTPWHALPWCPHWVLPYILLFR